MDLLLANTRCQLELDWGLVDEALASRQRIHELLDQADIGPESRIHLLQVDSGVALLAAQPELLRGALSTLTAALDEPALFTDRATTRAEIAARRAVLRYTLEDAEPAEERLSVAWMEQALGDARVDATWSFTLTMLLTRSAFAQGNLDDAGKWLSSFERRGVEGELAPLHRALLAAWRARLALARKAPHEELVQHFGELKGLYAERIESWMKSPLRGGGRGTLRSRDYHALLGALTELALELEGPRRAADLFLEHQVCGSLARQLNAPKGDLRQVQTELLQPAVGLLLFVPSDIRVHLFVVDEKGVVPFELPRVSGQTAKLRTLRNLLALPLGEQSEQRRVGVARDISALADEIGRWVLPPEVRERMRGWHGAYLVGADVLGEVPFEALPYGKSDLGRELGLATLPSVPVALALARRPAATADRQMLLVTSPRIQADVLGARPNLARLPIDEAAGRKLLLPFRRADLLRDEEASWARIEAEVRRSPPAILHLLVHGVPDIGRELSGGLALAYSASDEDGLLWCEDVTVSAPLVILSACSSARGPKRIGDDGLAQLGGAFLGHGALCIAQAAHEIALEPTLLLMVAFHARLAASDPPAEALRAARVTLAREPQYSHPFYLHAMRVVGLGWEDVASLGTAGR